MKRPAILLILVLGALLAQGQTSFRSITLDALEARLAAGGDTTYVLNFWATWCAPCIAEMPAMERFQERHREAGVHVLLISVDDPSRAAKSLPAFLGKRSLSVEVLHLNENKPHQYIDRISPMWSGSIPATLVRGSKPGGGRFHEGEMDDEDLDHLLTQFQKKP